MSNPHLSDLGRSLQSKATPARPADPHSNDSERLQGWLAQVGAEIAGPLTAALERVNELVSSGRIDRDSLRQLRDEIHASRRAGMIGQQLSRFASGRIRQSHERLQLGDAVGQVLNHRQRETEARGVALTPSLAPVEVVCDPSLLFSLLDSTVDWALGHAGSRIEFTTLTRPWPAAACLVCRFAQRAADAPANGAAASAPRSLDTLAWRMLEQTARAMGLRQERSVDGQDGEILLSIEFASTVDPSANVSSENALPDDRSGPRSDDDFAGSANSQPLAGSHVLVIASRREMRAAIRDALRSMSLIVDFVNSVDEAVAFCREGLPHAIIIEAIQSGERFTQFRNGIRAELPGFVFIEIVEEGNLFEMSGTGGSSLARVGRGVLTSALPSVLMFEMAKTSG